MFECVGLPLKNCDLGFWIVNRWKNKFGIYEWQLGLEILILWCREYLGLKVLIYGFGFFECQISGFRFWVLNQETGDFNWFNAFDRWSWIFLNFSVCFILSRSKRCPGAYKIIVTISFVPIYYKSLFQLPNIHQAYFILFYFTF